MKQQVPNVAPQSRAELEFSAVWLLDEELKDVKTTDFKYIPEGPKGPSTPLLDVNLIASPTSAKTQNYIGALRSYKQAKAVLMYSRLHPTDQGVLQICHIKEVLKLPVMVVFSILRDDPMPINMDITALPELMTEEFLGEAPDRLLDPVLFKACI